VQSTELCCVDGPLDCPGGFELFDETREPGKARRVALGDGEAEAKGEEVFGEHGRAGHLGLVFGHGQESIGEGVDLARFEHDKGLGGVVDPDEGLSVIYI